MRAPSRVMARVAAQAIAVIVVAAIAGCAASERSSPPDGSWVIPAGKEQANLALAEAAAAAIPGAAVAGVSANGEQLRIQLAGAVSTGELTDAPNWVAPPGGITVTTRDGQRFTIEVHGLARPGTHAESVRRALAGLDPQRVWIKTRSTQRGRARAPAPDTTDPWSGRWGIITPAATWVHGLLGVGPGAVMLVWWLLAMALTVFVVRATWRPEGSGQRDTESVPALLLGAAASLVVLGIALRIAFANGTPLESDEYGMYSASTAVFDADHDAWLHPPVFRALQLEWYTHLGTAPSSLAFRVPGLTLGVLALGLLAFALIRVRPAWTTIIALVPLSAGAAAVEATALARPYAAAAFLLSVVLAALVSPRRTVAHVTAAIIATGVLFWTNVVFAAVTAITVLVVLATARPTSTKRLAAVALAIAVWALPIVPGAIQAARSPTLPGHDNSGHLAAGQRPDNGMGRGSISRLASETIELTAFGTRPRSHALAALAVAVFLVVAVAGLTRPEARPWAIALLAATGIALLTGSLRSVRPRNLLFLPMLFAVTATYTLPWLGEITRHRLRGVRGCAGDVVSEVRRPVDNSSARPQ